MTKIPISDINMNIETRFRQNLGDLRPLIESIRRHGLLHPIVLSEDNQLICGRRRLAAYMQLKLPEIEVTFTSSKDLREAEADENNETIRKSFTVEEIAEIDEFFRDREETAAKIRQKKGVYLSDADAKGKSSSKIAARAGVSDRTLEKIRTIKEASTECDYTKDIWKKVSSGKVKVDKGYNQVRRFQRIKEAEISVETSLKSLSANEIFDLQFGDMQTLGENIPNNSIDLIFTDPPYNEASLALFGDLAKLADRVLKPGGSLITYAGHYAIFKINDLIQTNSELVYNWLIVVRHNGSKSRIHARHIWPYYKPLLWYYKPNLDGKLTIYQDLADLVESKAVRKDSHVWEQSTIEAEHMIKPLTVEGNIVLDPFMGSVTTGEAALNLNRRFIGIEVDKKHYSKTKQRLSKLRSDTCNVSMLAKNVQDQSKKEVKEKRQNIRQNPNQNYNNNNQNQNQEQSSNQLQLSVQSRRALDLLKKSRANRSEFMILGPNETVRLQFDPAKSHVEKKTFNGQTTERIAHSVVNVDDRTAGEKILSLTYKQSQPVEEAMEQGYTVMDITKVGEGFGLSYEINPIE